MFNMQCGFKGYNDSSIEICFPNYHALCATVVSASSVLFVEKCCVYILLIPAIHVY